MFSVFVFAVAAITCAVRADFLALHATKPLRLNSTSVRPAYGQNPIGVAFVPRQQKYGNLKEGDALVTNYANDNGDPGTGISIVKVDGETGWTSNFTYIEEAPPGCGSAVGLTAGVCVLTSGYVLVTSTPAVNGTSYSAKELGCIIMFDMDGKLVTTFQGSMIRGPWNMVCHEDLPNSRVYAFVSTGLPDMFTLPFDTNTAGLTQNQEWQRYINGIPGAGRGLNQTGSVVKMVFMAPERFPPSLVQTTYIANNFFWSDIAEKQMGPAGLALIGRDLYITDSFTDSLWVSPGAAASPIVSERPQFVCNRNDPTGAACPGFSSPLGLGVGPQGQLLVVNGENSTLVEVQNGQQVNSRFLDVAGVGATFQVYGIAYSSVRNTTLITGIASDTILKLEQVRQQTC